MQSPNNPNRNEQQKVRSGGFTDATQPTFSVVIPLYNKIDDIANTLNSVLNQTLKPLEIIVVDDGSTDGSDLRVQLDFCNQSHDEHKSEVKLIRQLNAGVSAARNTGIAHASGDYIAFIDADDSWSVHFLEELNKLANLHPNLAMLATAYQYQLGATHYEQPKIRQRKRARNKLLQSHQMTDYFDIASRGDLPFCASSVAIKRRFFELHGGFPVRERMGEDQCMWSRVALKSDIAYSPRGLSFYNVGASNRACLEAPPVEECPFSRRLQTYAQSSESLAESRRQAILRYTAAHLLDLADKNIASGNWQEARQLIDDERCTLKPVKKLRTRLGLVYAQTAARIGVRDRIRAYGW